jgi:hypothetical protein
VEVANGVTKAMYEVYVPIELSCFIQILGKASSSKVGVLPDVGASGSGSYEFSIQA